MPCAPAGALRCVDAHLHPCACRTCAHTCGSITACTRRGAASNTCRTAHAYNTAHGGNTTCDANAHNQRGGNTTRNTTNNNCNNNNNNNNNNNIIDANGGNTTYHNHTHGGTTTCDTNNHTHRGGHTTRTHNNNHNNNNHISTTCAAATHAPRSSAPRPHVPRGRGCAHRALQPVRATRGGTACATAVRGVPLVLPTARTTRGPGGVASVPRGRRALVIRTTYRATPPHPAHGHVRRLCAAAPCTVPAT